MNARDVAYGYAIGYNDGIGGGEPSDSWIRPADWPQLEVPQDNQIIALFNASRLNELGQASVGFSNQTSSDYRFEVDWGDGISEIYTAQDLIGKTYIIHQYYTIINGEKIWHDGPKLKNGDRVFIIKITAHDVLIALGQSCDRAMDVHVGKSFKLGYSSFNAKSTLKHIKFFDWEMNDETYIGGHSAYSLFRNLYLLESVESTKPSLKSIEAYMFANTRMLKHIDGLNECEYIGGYAFQESGIGEITVPLCSSTGQRAFSNCFKLSKAEFSENCAFGRYCFSGCYSLYPSPDGSVT